MVSWSLEGKRTEPGRVWKQFVHGSWFEFVVWWCVGSCKEAGSFDVVSESALSAAGPRVPRGHVPPGFEVPTELREVPFCFFIHLGFWCVCVCVRPRPAK